MERVARSPIDLDALRARLGAIRANYRGRSVDGRLVVVESDDWGAIRTPSPAALEAMRSRGYLSEESVYSCDALETSNDLERLFEVLSACTGSDGLPAVLTANTIVANPDFEKIEESQFSSYHYEPTTVTCQRNQATKASPDRWREGLEAGVYHPQFHGREHLHHRRWLARLRSGDEDTRFCFALGSTSSGKGDYSFMEALEWDDPSEVGEQAEELVDGLNIFEEIFGYRAKSFIAPCYIWDPALNLVLFENGIHWLQGTRVQKFPIGNSGEFQRLRHWFGESNEFGQLYNVRNVHFEPVMMSNLDTVSRALAQVSIAFRMRRPAVINTHRVNYIGSIDPENADYGLKSLAALLRSITRKWPDARFVTTEQLSEHLI